MCVSPIILNEHVVACRKCWQCKDEKVSNLVGKAIAQKQTSLKTHSVELTYGRDDGDINHLHASVLFYSDVQKYFKKLRNAGYEFKYIAVGEYGSKGARAHWHLIMFWENKVPERELNKRIACEHWEHGFTYWQEANYGAVRYATKYILKDVDKEMMQSHLSYSKKPPLGTKWFQQRAHKMARDGFAVQDTYYTFPDIRAENGKLKRFRMSGRTLSDFISSYIFYWNTYRPAEYLPVSDPVEQYLDQMWKEIIEREKYDMKEVRYDVPCPRATQWPAWAEAVEWSEKYQCWEAFDYLAVRKRYWREDLTLLPNGEIQKEGTFAWRRNVEVEAAIHQSNEAHLARVIAEVGTRRRVPSEYLEAKSKRGEA